MSTHRFVAFNQDGSCFVVGTHNAYRLFNSFPLIASVRRTFEERNHQADPLRVEWLFRTNLLALWVIPSRRLLRRTYQVTLWDDRQDRAAGQLVFGQPVIQVCLRRDCIVVAVQFQVHLYRLIDLCWMDTISTTSNESGLCTLSFIDDIVLACPGMQTGSVWVQKYVRQVDITTQPDTCSPTARTRQMPIASLHFQAHDHEIAALSVNRDGSLLATASTVGTVIRVFATSKGNRLREFRRGTDSACIFCICFDPSSQWLACTSDKGTVHVFRVNVSDRSMPSPASTTSNNDSVKLSVNNQIVRKHLNRASIVTKTMHASQAKVYTRQNLSIVQSTRTNRSGSTPGRSVSANPTSALSWAKHILPNFFSCEWSFAHFRIPEIGRVRSLVRFVTENGNAECNAVGMVIATTDGHYFKVSFDNRHPGKSCVQEQYICFDKASTETL